MLYYKLIEYYHNLFSKDLATKGEAIKNIDLSGTLITLPTKS